jgi:hypothetical protein
MGDILNGLAAAFGGPVQGPDPLAPLAGDPSSMSEPVMGFPSVALGGNPEAATYAKGIRPGDQPMLPGMDDGWQPKKPTILGAIADAIIMSQGGKPMFNLMRKERNIKDAMANYMDDPQGAIRRLQKVDPDMAYKLADKYHDNSIQDSRDRRMEEDRVFARGLGLLGVANERNYPRIRETVNGYWKKQGFDPGFELPETYEPEMIEGMRLGGMKSNQAMSYQSQDNYRQERLGQYREDLNSRIEDRNVDNTRADRNTDSMIGHRGVQQSQGQARLNETNRHNTVMENKPTASGKDGKSKMIPKVGYYEISPDKKIGRTFKADGKWHIYKKINGKVVEIGTEAP